MPVQVEKEKCDGCKSCEEICPTGGIAVVDGLASVNEEECIDCVACIDNCEKHAISPKE